MIHRVKHTAFDNNSFASGAYPVFYSLEALASHSHQSNRFNFHQFVSLGPCEVNFIGNLNFPEYVIRYKSMLYSTWTHEPIRNLKTKPNCCSCDSRNRISECKEVLESNLGLALHSRLNLIEKIVVNH